MCSRRAILLEDSIMGRLGLIVGAALLAGMAAGCGKPITVPPLAEEEVPTLAALGNFPDQVYRIEPGDKILIRYVFHPEMRQEDVVRPDGKISANLVGEIVVAGMTARDLEGHLVKATSDQLRNPEVIVSVSAFAEKTVFVGGEVSRPGTQMYRKGLTPLQAVIAAGGFRDTARPDSVVLVRVGARDQVVARKVDLDQVVNDGAREPLVLAPNDILFVPRSEIANANLWVRQHITDLIPLFRGMGIGASWPLAGN
jgi:protein involved in polysaccharide export with SLBB domain